MKIDKFTEYLSHIFHLVPHSLQRAVHKRTWRKMIHHDADVLYTLVGAAMGFLTSVAAGLAAAAAAVAVAIALWVK